MDQFLISRTSDSLNKGSIVETGRRCSLFTGLFARTRTQLGAGLPPPLHVPSPQKKSPALPTPQILAASQLPNPWCSLGEERACQRLGFALLLMEKHFPTSEQILPTLAGSPKGPCLYLGMSPRAQRSLRQPEGLQPTPWVQEAFKGSHLANFIPTLNSTRAKFPLEVKFGVGMLSLPFFFWSARGAKGTPSSACCIAS